jgi:hypothetical protein
MDTGAAVNVRRIFVGEEEGLHAICPRGRAAPAPAPCAALR